MFIWERESKADPKLHDTVLTSELRVSPQKTIQHDYLPHALPYAPTPT